MHGHVIKVAIATKRNRILVIIIYFLCDFVQILKIKKIFNLIFSENFKVSSVFQIIQNSIEISSFLKLNSSFISNNSWLIQAAKGRINTCHCPKVSQK